MVGGVLGELEKAQLVQDTIVIFLADHGMPFPRVKGQIYDDGFHIPFAVRWGDRVQAGREVTDFITFPDLAPTVFAIAGLDPHDQFTGQSFLPQLLHHLIRRPCPSSCPWSVPLSFC